LGTEELETDFLIDSQKEMSRSTETSFVSAGEEAQEEEEEEERRRTRECNQREPDRRSVDQIMDESQIGSSTYLRLRARTTYKKAARAKMITRYPCGSMLCPPLHSNEELVKTLRVVFAIMQG